MSEPRSRGVVWDHTDVCRQDRARLTGGCGATLWMTGLPASGKSTLARATEAALVRSGRLSYRLDGDNLRHGLTGDLGFSAEDRTENVRRVAQAAVLLADAGAVAVVSLVSPYIVDRDNARAIHAAAGIPFAEIHVATPLAECERRDPKGLYSRARAGELQGMTGVSDPYEEPPNPEVRVEFPWDTDEQVQILIAALDRAAAQLSA